MWRQVQGASVEDEARRAVAAASHLTDADAAAVAAMVVLARQIDYLDESDFLREDGKLDNVSVPTFLRYLDALGLTPAGRARSQIEAPKEGSRGKLAQLRAVSGGKA